MVSKGRLIERGLARSRPRFTARPRILIVCEGTATEPTYLAALIREFRATSAEVVIDDKGGVPKTLVERAVTEKRSAEAASRREKDPYLRYEEVWCVYDVDEHPNLNDARQQADANGIRLAISNPSFELWLLLHFQEQQAYIERAAAHRCCSTHMPGYVKRAEFRRLAPHVQLAEQRALALEARNESAGQPGANPSTGVVHLSTRLRAIGRI
jgi:hypothetical protein